VMLGKLFKIPVIVSARGSDINEFPRFRTIRPLVRWVMASCDAVIAVSQGLKERMVQLGCPSEKITVIPNGVDTARFHPSSQSHMRKRLGLPLNCRIVLSVGNLTENKGFQILIEAAARLRERYQDLMLIIIGEGAFRKELERQIRGLRIENAVRLVGAQPNETLCAWYNTADVFCLASRDEGCPNVVLEAMACGLPVVVTPVGSELISTSTLGMLSQRTPKDFQAAIEEVFRRPWDRNAIVAHARTKDWNDVAGRVMAVLSDVARRRRTRRYLPINTECP